MMLTTLTGDDEINDALMVAMEAVIDKLVMEKTITEEQGINFLKHHLVMLMSPEGGFKRWFMKTFREPRKNSKITVVYIDHPLEK